MLKLPFLELPDQCPAHITTREHFAISIRRSHRNKTFNHRRALLASQLTDNPPSDPHDPSIDELIGLVWSQDSCQVESALVKLEKFIQFYPQQTVRSIIQSGHTVARLLSYTQAYESETIRDSAGQIVTIISEKETQHIIDCNGLKFGLQMLVSSSLSVVSQGVCMLTNLCSESQQIRDYVLDNPQILERLREIIVEQVPPTKVITEICWFANCLALSEPFPDSCKLKPILPVICVVLSLGMVEDNETLSACLWILVYHADVSPESPITVSEVLRKMVTLCLQDNIDIDVINATLKLLVLLSKTGTEGIQYLLNIEDLLELCELAIGSSISSLCRDASRLLSNLITGPWDQARAIIYNGTISKIIDAFISSNDHVRYELTFFFANLAIVIRQMSFDRFFIQSEIIPEMVQSFKNVNDLYLTDMLDNLSTLLNCSQIISNENFPPLAHQFYDHGLQDLLQEMFDHPDFDIAMKARAIVIRFFDKGDDPYHGDIYYGNEEDFI